MIIDVHGHYTTAPPSLQAFRDQQLQRLSEGPYSPSVGPSISDERLRESIESNQLSVMLDRGIDVVLISPKASGMEHHVESDEVAVEWAQVNNDLIARICDLFPRAFAPVCQLPQTPRGGLQHAVRELRRCVEELGFVGCNLNPDPSGRWETVSMTDERWFPVYEALCELDVPAMIHVSSSCNPASHTLGAHYLHADTAVFMQLLEGDLFARFPDLRFVIPHGGGAVPYHWGRFEGLAERLGRPPLAEHLLQNVFFDTCVYHQPGMRLLFEVVPHANLLFASEMLGAVRGTDPATGSGWDDTRRYVDGLDIDDAARVTVTSDNALRVYPRLADRVGMSPR